MKKHRFWLKIAKKQKNLIRYYLPRDNLIFRIIKMPFSRYYWKYMSSEIDIVTGIWDKLILKYKMPFVKKSMFTTDKDKKRVQQSYKKVISSVSDYPLELISKYMNRVE